VEQGDGDRTRELEAEVARLRAQAEMLEEILSRTNDVIYRVNMATGRLDFVSLSVKRLFGLSREEVLEQPPEVQREQIHPDDRERVTGTIERLRRGGPWNSGEALEYRVRHVDGSYRCVREVREVVVNDAGEPVAFVGTVSDVTDSRRAERERLALESQIQQAQKLESLGVLAGGIAHDFNNLLVGILGNAGLALLDLTPEAPARQAVREIEETAVRATELVRQMLAYSGKGRFVIEPLDLRGVVEQMTHLLEVSVSKNAVLRYEYGRGVPHVDADATQVRQVIMNLVTNASDAIGERSGVVSVATGAMECDRAYLSETYLDDDLEEGVYAYIEVSDSGSGIEPDSVDKIFDPFYSTKFTGRGLGLAAVLGIVRGHRGAIKVYSEPGEGSTFKALFPAREHAHEVDALPGRPPLPWPTRARAPCCWWTMRRPCAPWAVGCWSAWASRWSRPKMAGRRWSASTRIRRAFAACCST
jgi:PAS domain S-box-containing protein